MCDTPRTQRRWTFGLQLSDMGAYGCSEGYRISNRRAQDDHSQLVFAIIVTFPVRSSNVCIEIRPIQHENFYNKQQQLPNIYIPPPPYNGIMTLTHQLLVASVYAVDAKPRRELVVS